MTPVCTYGRNGDALRMAELGYAHPLPCPPWRGCGWRNEPTDAGEAMRDHCQHGAPVGHQWLADVLSIDAWRDGDGWTWNDWRLAARVPEAWLTLSNRRILREMRRATLIGRAGQVAIEREQGHVTIVDRGTRRPLLDLDGTHSDYRQPCPWSPRGGASLCAERIDPESPWSGYVRIGKGGAGTIPTDRCVKCSHPCGILSIRRIKSVPTHVRICEGCAHVGAWKALPL